MSAWYPLPTRLALLAETQLKVRPHWGGLFRFGELGQFEIEQQWYPDPPADPDDDPCYTLTEKGAAMLEGAKNGR